MTAKEHKDLRNRPFDFVKGVGDLIDFCWRDLDTFILEMNTNFYKALFKCMDTICLRSVYNCLLHFSHPPLSTDI